MSPNLWGPQNPRKWTMYVHLKYWCYTTNFHTCLYEFKWNSVCMALFGVDFQCQLLSKEILPNEKCSKISEMNFDIAFLTVFSTRGFPQYWHKVFDKLRIPFKYETLFKKIELILQYTFTFQISSLFLISNHKFYLLDGICTLYWLKNQQKLVINRSSFCHTLSRLGFWPKTLSGKTTRHKYITINSWFWWIGIIWICFLLQRRVANSVGLHSCIISTAKRCS